MAGRHWSTAKNNVTLHANKLSIRFPLVHLVVEYAAVVSRCRDVTALSAATRFHRRLQRLQVVTLRALNLTVHFMSKRAGSSSPAPYEHRDRIVKTSRLGYLRIEIDVRVHTCRLMTTATTLRQRRQLALLVVTAKALAVCQRQ